ncbi:hypothetical protein THRCLA_01839 [Thraustotheca clavata]|uniref:Dienelactone hydrolase domain-containing protein n=1 Tax=Thraustotheca clavata TaxID=74557 RepID=A0A1W0A731_9STRA|nr:hypothetical protein THRCLA_01839 [Thraustotheca clavata]
MTCCPPGSLPACPTNDDSPPILLGSTKAYFYDNSTSSVCILVFPDVFGPTSGRTKEYCVKLSSMYKVALLDLVDDYIIQDETRPSDVTVNANSTRNVKLGEKIMSAISHPFQKLSSKVKMIKWAKSHPFEQLLININGAVEHLKNQHHVTTFAGIGYCWGSWVLGKYAGVPNSPLAAGVHCHPSWRVEDIYHGPNSGKRMTNTINSPQLLLCAGNDPEWLHPGGVVDEALKAKSFGLQCKVVLFKSMIHGWVIRGDITNDEVAVGVNEAWETIYPFLHELLP